MGTLIHLFALPPFLITLGGMFLARGLAFVVHPESLSIDHPFYGEFISQTLSVQISRKLSIPFTAFALIAVVIAASMLARWSRFGRNVRAIGSSESSARLMGVPVGSTKILVYTLGGFLSALGGVVATFYMQSGNPLRLSDWSLMPSRRPSSAARCCAAALALSLELWSVCLFSGSSRH